DDVVQQQPNLTSLLDDPPPPRNDNDDNQARQQQPLTDRQIRDILEHCAIDTGLTVVIRNNNNNIQQQLRLTVTGRAANGVVLAKHAGNGTIYAFPQPPT